MAPSINTLLEKVHGLENVNKQNLLKLCKKLSHGGEVMSLCECMQQKSRLWRFSITMEGLIFNFEDFANKNLYLKFKQS